MQPKKYLFYVSQNYSYAILRPLQTEIKKRGDIVKWFLHGNEVNSDYIQKDEVVLNDILSAVAYKPDAVFVPGNVVPSFLSGIKVAVFHGFNSGKLNRKGREDHFNIRGCFDLYCTQGPNTTENFQWLANKHQHFLVLETGWPALDPLFSVKREYNNSTPTVLMCSTFSRNLTCAPILFDKIKELSSTGKWSWLVQFHPKMDRKIVEQYKSIQSEYLTFVETDNVIPLLQKADAMLCDTSSVLTMFLLQGKPVVTFNNISPDEYLLNIDDPGKLEESLELALKRPEALMEKISLFIKNTHPTQDGMASCRVLDKVENMIDTDERPLKAKPMNLIRSFKMRKSLGYWKLK